MNAIEFSQGIPAKELARIFKDYFEQHMIAYNMLRGVQFVRINEVNLDTASIMYSVRLLEGEDKEKLLKRLTLAGSVNIYGKVYTPELYLNGDLLCITIKK